jgi:serine/threonine protein kinase
VLVREFAESTLHELARECRELHGGIPLPQLVGYVHDVAEALDYLHRRRLWHGGVRPDNVLIDATHAKLSDWGMVSLQEAMMLVDVEGPFAAALPSYFAPELVQGKPGLATDQFSLAVVYVEQRLGRRPFPGKHIAEQLLAILTAEPDLEGLSVMEQAAVRQGLAKDPQQRFPTCTAFAEALQRAVA